MNRHNRAMIWLVRVCIATAILAAIGLLANPGNAEVGSVTASYSAV